MLHRRNPVKLPTRQFFLFLAFSTYLIYSPPVQASDDDRDVRDVRLSYVQGDVRLSRGNGKHPDLNKPWEQAQAGEPIAQGFALATGEGRAEIACEDGSSVYLAENSLLLFIELSAPDERNLTRVTLATGTATFWLRPAEAEDYFVQTPTDTLRLSAPEWIYDRIDAYLDATALTSQAENGERIVPLYFDEDETLIWLSQSGFHIAKGQTIFLRQGEILNLPTPNLAKSPSVPDSRTEEQHKIDSDSKNNQTQDQPTASQIAWDNWVSARVQQERASMTAALKASGLSSPIPDLVNLYEHGTFFDCEYGKCWEPIEQEPEKDIAQQPQPPGTQTPAPTNTVSVFQPLTVQWQETWQPWCGPVMSQTVTRVARTPEELEKLLRKKQRAQSLPYPGSSYWADCYTGYWFPRHGHYARVITPPPSPTPPRTMPPGKPPKHPPICQATNCMPGNHPHPVWVRAGKQVGFVPRHPNDIPGKPPLNLKNDLVVPPSKTGQPSRLLASELSQKIKVLDKAPKEFQNVSAFHTAPVTAPEIRAHLMLENTRQGPVASANRSISPSAATNHAPLPITYDDKRHSFTMPSSSTPGEHSQPVAIGGITKHGSVASFADGHSSHYAASFDRSSVAANYGGGSHNSGSYGGAGRNSALNSGGSHTGSYSGSGHNSSAGGGHNSGSSGGSHSSGSSSGGGHSQGPPAPTREVVAVPRTPLAVEEAQAPPAHRARPAVAAAALVTRNKHSASLRFDFFWL
jgi:hypothetical protein